MEPHVNIEKDARGRFVRGHAVKNPFQKGNSFGAGRPAIIKTIRAHAKLEADAVVGLMMEVATDQRQNTGDRLRAMESILEWAWGNPHQKRYDRLRDQLTNGVE
jgi:hypothetical protein